MKKMPKSDFYCLVSLFDEFSKLCAERKIKFNKYTEDQLWDFLMMYKQYKSETEKPPF